MFGNHQDRLIGRMLDQSLISGFFLFSIETLALWRRVALMERFFYAISKIGQYQEEIS